jgi:TolB-like protein
MNILVSRNILFVTLVITLCSCSKRYNSYPVYFPFSIGESENHGVGRFKTLYLADQIDSYYQGTDPGPVGITTFVDLNNLDTSSSFGRIYSEQMVTELSMRGYEIKELRVGKSLRFVNNAGEFSLTRDILNSQASHSLSGIIVGTYSASPDRVYVNARLIDPKSSLVLSAASIEIDRDSEIDKLLRSGGNSSKTLERLPVEFYELRKVNRSNHNPEIVNSNNIRNLTENKNSHDPLTKLTPPVDRKLDKVIEK